MERRLMKAPPLSGGVRVSVFASDCCSADVLTETDWTTCASCSRNCAVVLRWVEVSERDA